MDILYIVGENCSKCNNLELRCSLRSIEKYGKNVGRIFVAGFCPEWLSDEVVKVPFTQPWQILQEGEQETQDNLAKKHANILATILHVVDNTDIGAEFLVSMDDHMYIRGVNFDKYPFYCKRFGKDNHLPTSENTEYKKFLATTRERLEADGLESYYFCLHRNMHMSRKTISDCRLFLEAVVSTPLPVECHAYLLNYRLSHDVDFKPTIVRDVKLIGGGDWWKANPSNTECFSTADFCEGKGLAVLLRGLYNQKSKYEI